MKFLPLFILSVLLVWDWEQTLKIAKTPSRWYERNPFLGKHPSTIKVEIWFSVYSMFWYAAFAAAYYGHMDWHYVIAGSLIAIAAEVVCIWNNIKIGL